MDYALIGITVLAAAVTLLRTWRAGGDDPNWDLRWRALDPDDQARLAVAALSYASTAALGDSEERELAEGFRQREDRRRARLDLALLAAFIFTAALMLIGVASFSSFGLIIAAYGMLGWGIESFRNRQIKRKLRLPASEPAPTTAP